MYGIPKLFQENIEDYELLCVTDSLNWQHLPNRSLFPLVPTLTRTAQSPCSPMSKPRNLIDETIRLATEEINTAKGTNNKVFKVAELKQNSLSHPIIASS